MKKVIITLLIIASLPMAIDAQHYGFYGNGKSIGVRYRGRSMYGGEVRNSGTLGMSSSVSAPGITSGSSDGGFTSIGGGSSSGFSNGVVFGRTGTSVSTRQGLSLSSTATLPQLATTTNSYDSSDGDQAEQQGFLEAPDYAPLGDAVLPLLLLIIPIIIVKMKGWKN